LKLWSEEKKNLTEHLMARAVSRRSMMGSFLLISLMASLVMQLLAVTGMWSAGAAVMENPVPFDTIFNAAMVYLPALWVMTALAALLIGFLPGGAGLTWLYLGYSFFVVYLGELMQLPAWMARLSPFGNVPRLPVEDMDFTKLAILTIIALILISVGFIGYQKRDMQKS